MVAQRRPRERPHEGVEDAEEGLQLVGVLRDAADDQLVTVDAEVDALRQRGCYRMVTVVVLTFALGIRGVGRVRRTGHPDLLAPGVIPIVIGYAVAHYLSLLVLGGQRTLINLSDPLGQGGNAFGTAELGIGQLWLETPAVTATIQLASIVGGHVLGVLVAHELALRVLPVRRRLTGQLPLLLVMIGYTCGGLLLLFSP